MSLGGEDAVVMGADLDGTSPLPAGRKNAPEIIGAEELYLLADRLLQLNYSEKQVRKIFSENAKAFLKRNDINEQISH
jgi:microsomal dipeptidase-like Zn-dependent dipeptidase